ncbi:MAG: hypothetical protein RR573_01515 [Oscillospiraceae bacterium]
MDVASIATFAFQTVITVLIGAVGWGIKNAMKDLKDKTIKNADEINKVQTELNDLKSDLPLVYVLREDFIRVLNNVDTNFDKVNGKIDKVNEKLDKLLFTNKNEKEQ